MGNYEWEMQVNKARQNSASSVQEGRNKKEKVELAIITGQGGGRMRDGHYGRGGGEERG